MFFYINGAHRNLHVPTPSFPTRRSSELAAGAQDGGGLGGGELGHVCFHSFSGTPIAPNGPRFSSHAQARSEEHTSELQSLMRISYAVFCLKKKKAATRLRNPSKRDTTRKGQHTTKE